MSIENFLNWIGYEVKDKLTGFVGVVVSIDFQISGCVQADVRPILLDKEGEIGKGYWFDLNRLTVINDNRRMPVPKFNEIVLPIVKTAYTNTGPMKKDSVYLHKTAQKV